MRSKVHIWILTGVMFGAAAVRAASTFLDYPDRSSGAVIQWSLVALWLVVPLLAVWRQLRGSEDPALQQWNRDAATRLVVVAYAPLFFTMGLIDRLR